MRPADSRLNASVEQAAAAHGLAPDPSETVEAGLPGVRRDAAIRNVLRGTLEGRPLLIYEARRFIQAGAVPVLVSQTVYAVGTPPWPKVRIAPRSVAGRVAARLGRAPGLKLDDPQFNRTFNVKTEDEDFAITLLSPEMQAFMLDKRSVGWRIGGRRLCLIYDGPLKPSRMERSLRRLRDFWSLVPPELEHWGAT